MSGAASALGDTAGFFGMLLRYLPTPELFAVGVCLLVPAGLLNQLPMPSLSMSGGPASFSACITRLQNQGGVLQGQRGARALGEGR